MRFVAGAGTTVEAENGLEGGTVEEKGLEADGGLEDAALCLLFKQQLQQQQTTERQTKKITTPMSSMTL